MSKRINESDPFTEKGIPNLKELLKELKTDIQFKLYKYELLEKQYIHNREVVECSIVLRTLKWTLDGMEIALHKYQIRQLKKSISKDK